MTRHNHQAADVTSANPARHFSMFEGPFAVVRGCAHCKFSVTVRKGLPGVGRGYGLREDNKARGEMIQHVKAAHPEKLK